MAEGGPAQGSTAEGMNLRVVPVPGLNRREALDYVTSRLSDYPDQRIEALDLGEDLDGLPLALAQATAAMSARRQGCREYRALLAERIGHMVDRLSMCHTLDFKSSFGSSSITLDPADLLLSKLQIVELNAKDAHDIFHLLSGLRVGRDSARPSIDPDRFGSVLAADWGWWRTVTRNLAKLPDLLSSQPGLAPPYPRFDALTQAKQLQEVAETVPKGLKWKTRARVGDRVRWYELPEEVDH